MIKIENLFFSIFFFPQNYKKCSVYSRTMETRLPISSLLSYLFCVAAFQFWIPSISIMQISFAIFRHQPWSAFSPSFFMDFSLEYFPFDLVFGCSCNTSWSSEMAFLCLYCHPHTAALAQHYCPDARCYVTALPQKFSSGLIYQILVEPVVHVIFHHSAAYVSTGLTRVLLLLFDWQYQVKYYLDCKYVIEICQAFLYGIKK